MKRVTILTLMCLSFMMVNLVTTNAQLPPDCEGMSPCDGQPWTVRTWTSRISEYGTVNVTVTYRWRVCNGVVEYMVDNITALDNGQHLPDWSIEEYDINTFLDLFDLHLLEQTHGDVDAHTNIPVCGVGTSLRVKIYSARCGVWLKCSFIIDPNETQRECDTGYDPPYEPYLDINGDWRVDHWKWFSCGEACCVKTWEVCRQVGATSATDRILIQNVDIVKGECTLEGTFRKWEDNSIIPCNAGCK